MRRIVAFVLVVIIAELGSIAILLPVLYLLRDGIIDYWNLTGFGN